MNYPIDLVYTWVDDSDPAWRAARDKALRDAGAVHRDNCGGRYFDNDELKYSLRGAEKFAPWINHIFIITAGQTPKWLNTKNKKITVIGHRDIIPEKYLPTFSSTFIEHWLHNIPGLSERFLYANDDMFFGGAVAPEYFFDNSGRPIVRAKPKSNYSIKNMTGKNPGSLWSQVKNAKLAVYKIFGKNHNYAWMPAHNIDSYCKSELKKIADLFAPQITEMGAHRFRSPNDIQRIIYHEYGLADGTAVMRKYSVLKRILMWCAGREYIVPFYTKDAAKLRRHNLFCINNSGSNPARDAANREWLANFLPKKSEFEK
ncbi:MAG: Stealth CR1 domain-containing protein [Rickettsiales bacterium]|jgi:hypothetical protein|nr:Stealth CR1 domain-containing protein [Rickettsiales bacterium]